MRIRLGRWLLLVELRGQCRHNVVGMCPRCHPAESRTLRNLKLSTAIAWLARISTRDPVRDFTPDELRGMAKHGLKTIAEIDSSWLRRIRQ